MSPVPTGSPFKASQILSSEMCPAPSVLIRGCGPGQLPLAHRETCGGTAFCWKVSPRGQCLALSQLCPKRPAQCLAPSSHPSAAESTAGVTPSSINAVVVIVGKLRSEPGSFPTGVLTFPKKGSCSHFSAGPLTNSLVTPLRRSRLASSLAGWFAGIDEFSLAEGSAD